MKVKFQNQFTHRCKVDPLIVAQIIFQNFHTVFFTALFTSTFGGFSTGPVRWAKLFHLMNQLFANENTLIELLSQMINFVQRERQMKNESASNRRRVEELHFWGRENVPSFLPQLTNRIKYPSNVNPLSLDAGLSMFIAEKIVTRW